MSTITADPETISVVDLEAAFEHEKCCECVINNTVECDAPVAWIHICRHCGGCFLTCETHHGVLVNNKFATLRCNCGRIFKKFSEYCLATHRV